MTATRLLALTAILLTTPVQAETIVSYPRSGFSCTTRHTLHGVDSLKKLPDSIRLALSPVPGVMADQSENFNSGDAEVPGEPFSGFFWAGRNGGRWYVLTIENHRGYSSMEIQVFDARGPGAAVETAFGYLDETEDPCRVMDRVMDGSQRLWPPRLRKP